MSLSINHSTSIRPLGEEHLRMFRRMSQEREVIPRVTLPTDVLSRPKLTIIGRRLKIGNAERRAKEEGVRFPTLREVIFAVRDKGQYEALRARGPIWTSDVGIKISGIGVSGVCRTNYAKGRLEVVSHKEWEKLPEDQKARVWTGNRPVAAYGYDGVGGRKGLSVNGFSERQAARVAFVEGDEK